MLTVFIATREDRLRTSRTFVSNQRASQFDGGDLSSSPSDDNEDDQLGLAFSQALTHHGNEIVAELDYLRLPVMERNKGVSKMLLNLNLQQYEAMGVSKIKLEAALSNGC